jgi:hypothetical protein
MASLEYCSTQDHQGKLQIGSGLQKYKLPRSKLAMVFVQQKSRPVSLGTDESHEEGAQMKLSHLRMLTKSPEVRHLFHQFSGAFERF